MKNKALFLDRDGVLNKETGDYIRRPEDFIVNPGVAEALKRFSDEGYLLIVISNQGGIGKKLYSHETLENIHKKLRSALAEKNVKLTEIYYCPHHPSSSKCICRKPDSQMLEKAIARFDINPETSYFIGDKERDGEAALKANVKFIFIQENAPLSEIKL